MKLPTERMAMTENHGWNTQFQELKKWVELHNRMPSPTLNDFFDSLPESEIVTYR